VTEFCRQRNLRLRAASGCEPMQRVAENSETARHGQGHIRFPNG